MKKQTKKQRYDYLMSKRILTEEEEKELFNLLEIEQIYIRLESGV